MLHMPVLLVKFFTWLGVQRSRLLCITLSADLSIAEVVGAAAPTSDGALLPPANAAWLELDGPGAFPPQIWVELDGWWAFSLWLKSWSSGLGAFPPRIWMELDGPGTAEILKFRSGGISTMDLNETGWSWDIFDWIKTCGGYCYLKFRSGGISTTNLNWIGSSRGNSSLADVSRGEI